MEVNIVLVKCVPLNMECMCWRRKNVKLQQTYIIQMRNNNKRNFFFVPEFAITQSKNISFAEFFSCFFFLNPNLYY